MTDVLQSLNEVLADEIPLTGAMGLHVRAYDGRRLVLAAPLAPNVNHKSTAFGGSLYSCAVLAGWGMVYLKLREAGLEAHIVIHESRIGFHHPVDADFEAVCEAPGETDWARLEAAFRRRGRARLELVSQILCDGRPAVRFQGRYVIHR